MLLSVRALAVTDSGSMCCCQYLQRLLSRIVVACAAVSTCSACCHGLWWRVLLSVPAVLAVTDSGGVCYCQYLWRVTGGSGHHLVSIPAALAVTDCGGVCCYQYLQRVLSRIVVECATVSTCGVSRVVGGLHLVPIPAALAVTDSGGVCNCQYLQRLLSRMVVA